ncbi:MAG TPA: DUF4870 domain-containing protein [Terriglobales bacterium]|jgi:uncharacterized Tic20 family protein|nr:DUF4870 domain-containing protein [Terriglobales bacterium]
MTELPPPTQNERSMAMLVHILAIISGIFAPLIIYVIKRDSKFVSFHALQSLFWHLLYAAGVALLVVLFFVIVISQAAFSVAARHGPPSPLIFMAFPMLWFSLIVSWLINVLLGVTFAVKTNAGEWVTYPLVGAWARSLVGI